MTDNKTIATIGQIMLEINRLLAGQGAGVAISVASAILLNVMRNTVPPPDSAEADALIDEIATWLKQAYRVNQDEPPSSQH